MVDAHQPQRGREDHRRDAVLVHHEGLALAGAEMRHRDRLADGVAAGCQAGPDVAEPSFQNGRRRDLQRQFREFLADPCQHHLLLFADAAAEDLMVGETDAVEVGEERRPMGMQQRHPVHPRGLSQHHLDIAVQALGVLHHAGLQRGFEAVGKGEGADRQRRIRELQQPRQMRHAARRPTPT